MVYRSQLLEKVAKRDAITGKLMPYIDLATMGYKGDTALRQALSDARRIRKLEKAKFLGEQLASSKLTGKDRLNAIKTLNRSLRELTEQRKIDVTEIGKNGRPKIVTYTNMPDGFYGNALELGGVEAYNKAPISPLSTYPQIQNARANIDTALNEAYIKFMPVRSKNRVDYSSGRMNATPARHVADVLLGSRKSNMLNNLKRYTRRTSFEPGTSTYVPYSFRGGIDEFIRDTAGPGHVNSFLIPDKAIQYRLGQVNAAHRDRGSARLAYENAFTHGRTARDFEDIIATLPTNSTNAKDLGLSYYKKTKLENPLELKMEAFESIKERNTPRIPWGILQKLSLD